MKESFDMEQPEQEPSFILLEGAEGAIQTKEIHDQDTVDELTQDVVEGVFLVPTAKSIPCKCIDGRSCMNATEGPNAAGGTETIFVAQDLTRQSPAGPDETIVAGMQKLVQDLQSQNLPVGGHSDDHHEDPNDSGCGDNDRLPKIYDMIVRKADLIKQYAEAILGTVINDETHKLIIRNAAARTDFSRGSEVLRVLESEGAQLETLEGSHNEVVAAINFRSGTTLDRTQVADKYGPSYQSFQVDAWSFQKAAEAISDTIDETQQRVVAMTYYNLATALVLCGPNMRVVVVK